MANPVRHDSEAQRLEALWGGAFGNEYIERNRRASQYRRPFWTMQMTARPARTVLEVGCNTGANLTWLSEGAQVVGADISRTALVELRKEVPAARAVAATARQLPFRDGSFDLAFTTGVLIHQPSDVLPSVMAEIVRCSGKYVLCGEYFAEELTEVPYRGHRGALFKLDFGHLYQELFPELALLESGFLSKAEGWDDLTYWVFEKMNR